MRRGSCSLLMAVLTYVSYDECRQRGLDAMDHALWLMIVCGLYGCVVVSMIAK